MFFFVTIIRVLTCIFISSSILLSLPRGGYSFILSSASTTNAFQSKASKNGNSAEKKRKPTAKNNNKNDTNPLLRTMYPLPQLIHHGTLQVDSIHEIYFEEYGQQKQQTNKEDYDNHDEISNKSKKTAAANVALSLHGGPGAGSFPNHSRFFNSTFYNRIILFDQRGCGKSKPRGETKDNTLEHLIMDIEKLRTHLNIEKWSVILGGSWGSTLALAYAQSYPNRVGGLVLRGICLFRNEEIEWLFGDTMQSNVTSDNNKIDENKPFLHTPCIADIEAVSEQWKQFKDTVHVEENEPKTDEFSMYEGDVRDLRRDSLHRYYDYLLGSNPYDRIIAAKSWMMWEMSVSKLLGERDIDLGGENAHLLIGKSNENTWSFQSIENEDIGKTKKNSFELRSLKRWSKNEQQKGESKFDSVSLNTKSRPFRERSQLPKDGDKRLDDISDEDILKFIPSQAMLTCYYSVNNELMMEKFDLTSKERIDRIRHIPCIAIQGGEDVICPPDSALDLKEAWPEMELRIVLPGKHSQYDPPITSELVKSTDHIARLK